MTDLTMFWGGLCKDFGLEKPLSVKRFVGCFVGAWKIRTLRAVQRMEAWLVEFQRETKTRSGLLGEDCTVSGWLELKNQL